MAQIPRPPQSFRFITTTSMDSRRITFEPDSLLVESRDLIGSYQASDEVFWDEVRAVYTWSAPNWNMFGGWALVIVIFGALALAITGSSSGGNIWMVAAILLVALAGSAFVCIRLAPRQWYRVESTRLPVEFATGKKGTLEELLSHVVVENGNGASGAVPRPDTPFAS